ncbi:MAG: phytoene desaturase family protein [Ferruginibacter sp.]
MRFRGYIYRKDAETQRKYIMHPKKAIIIGSGVAGMAAAIRLAVQGYAVCVYETNANPGGKLSMFEKDGYRFDAGPSLFTQPQNIKELFELAEEPMDNYFNYTPVDIACKYFFENGKIVNAFTDKTKFASELADKLGEQPASINNYLKRAGKLYQHVAAIFLDHSLHCKRTWLHTRILKALAALRLSYLFSTLHKYNRKQFSSAEATQLFNRYATYNGSDPYKAPAMLSVISHLEHNEGIFYPAGGMISITNALFRLAENKGVRFYFNSPVQRIIYHEGKITGVVVNNENVYAAVVVSNVDIYFTYKNLLNHLSKAQRILKQERSSSAVVFYWGVKKHFPQLQLHNILFSKNYKEEFNSIFKKKTIYQDPTIYINITSKMETGHAPNGKENWFVMINVPSNDGQDWEQLKNQLRDHVIEKINRILQADIETFIETEEILDPLLIESSMGSYSGALYGASSNSGLAAFSRPANFTNYIRGLYFCGGTVHPGGGIPLCFKSAKIVAELIERDYKKTKH